VASETRDHIKRVAMSLFGERGVEGVSTREIIAAVGQKNVSLLSYYFGSKDALLRELIADVVRVVDADRSRLLRDMEAAGGPHSVRDVLGILVRHPRLSYPPSQASGPVAAFIDMMLATKADLMFETIGPELGPATRACLEHLRRMAPGLPEPILSQRLRLAILLAFSALSSQRDAAAQPDAWPDGWNSPLAVENLTDALQGLLMHDASPQTLACGQVAGLL
jgi:AcrR family transcriptional regulator